MKKSKLKFYRYWYAPIGFKDYDNFEWNKWLPKFEYSKNVQGWWFTQNYTLYWFIWAINYSITIHSDYDVERSKAHEMNVKKYMTV
jgi:hypothetical protein